MADRAPLPGELYLDAVVLDENRQVAVLGDQGADQSDWARPVPFDDRTLEAAQERGSYVALRWVLNSSLGIPLEPFTVWRRPAAQREKPVTIRDWHRVGPDLFWWDGLTEMLWIEVDVSAAVTLSGIGQRDTDPVTTASGGPGTVVLTGGPMLGVRVSDPSAVTAARGLSVVTAANGDGWQPFERVGLPLDDNLLGRSYYDGSQQGPIAAPTDPLTAAAQRLKQWGPVVGWGPLAGLPPWVAPDPSRLVTEFGQDLVPDLVEIMATFPPPDLGKQRLAERPPRPLDRLEQAIGAALTLNTGADNLKSQIITRPLQALTTGVATDAWASLTLGFGTGAPVGKTDQIKGLDDFMITAPWRGLIEVAVPSSWPFPWADDLEFPPPPPVFVSKEVERELAAVVLSPTTRSAPGLPSPLTPVANYLEGASPVDSPYRVSIKIQTPRPPMLPAQARASAYGLARFTKPAIGGYRLVQRPLASGWVPIGSAAPVRDPQQPADPALTPATVMLRDSGLPLPVTGANLSYQYAAAASDLFGQWSPWVASWLSVGPVKVQSPAVTVTRATASAGPGNADPCTAQVTVEVVWDAAERTLGGLQVTVDVDTPPPPPAILPAPQPVPQPGLTAATLAFGVDAAGMPTGVPAGITVTPLHIDDTPVTSIDPWDAADGDDRRYRIILPAVTISYGAAWEKTITVYLQAQETIRPGEWSAWSHAKESVLAPNPIPPPPHQPLPGVYPLWASLPDAAGLSYAPVSWPPTGAWGYRVYEATEAALLAACQQPGPVLTKGYADRMQALFDLYAVPGNLPALKAAYRKLGTEAIVPAVHNGAMQFQALLPRGSALIHCFIVVGVTESAVTSDWPVPDQFGRKSFLAYAIPRRVQPPIPQVQARIGAGGTPEVVVTVGGADPVTAIRLYRATSPVLARSIGTMARLADTVPDPASWQQTVIADPGAPIGWDRLQYRAVAVPDDDPDHAGMAVASPESKAYALLYPPPDAPAVALRPDAAHSGLTVAVVRVDTDAPRRAKNVGDHALSWVSRRASVDPVRGRLALSAIADISEIPTLAAGSDPAGYIGGVLYLRLDRSAGEPIALAVDVTDPLGRSRHVLLDIEAFAPDPAPLIAQLSAVRHSTLLDRAVWVAARTNVPLPPDPARDWTLRVSWRQAAGGLVLPTTRSFAVSTIPVVVAPGDLRPPGAIGVAFAIARVAGTGDIALWFRATVPMRVVVALINSAGASTSASGVTT